MRPSATRPWTWYSQRTQRRCAPDMLPLLLQNFNSGVFPMTWLLKSSRLTAVSAVQALRQSLLKKYTTVRSHLDNLHNSRMSAYEKAECLESIRAQIQAAWRTDEIRRSKPSPQVSCG